MAASAPKLYVLPGSHPCAAVEAALALKSIEYDRVDLLPSVEQLVGPLRYGGRTVPGMRLNGERLVGSRTIMRRLDLLVPEPALLPGDDSADHARVLEAERWGDESFQDVPRHILDIAFLRRPASIESYAGDAKLPLPTKLLRPALPLTARLLAVKSKANDESARAYVSALPAQLDRIDGWIAEGVIGGEQLNAADFVILPSLALLDYRDDLRAQIAPRPAWALLERVLPEPAATRGRDASPADASAPAADR
jgi:glutathione S-transferase